MPRKHYWTPAQDDTLRAHRARRQSWDEIAASLGVSRSTARDRGRAIGATRPQATSQVQVADMLADPNREPLPAGHPIAWEVLTEGTLLGGSASPWPPLPPHIDFDPVARARPAAASADQPGDPA